MQGIGDKGVGQPLLAEGERKFGFGLQIRQHLVFVLGEPGATLFGQSLDEPALGELMALFAQAWNDLGEHVGNGFQSFVESSGGTAAGFVASLLRMPLYQDVARYAGRDVAFLKRAQITVADLHGRVRPVQA